MDSIARERGAAVAGRGGGWPLHALLIGAVSAASSSAVLVRYAPGAEPLAIAFWRCAAGAIVLAPLAASKLRSGSARPVRLSALAGLFLALHFATWITSIGLTSIASSVLLVSTTPVFVAIAARLLFGERLAWLGWLGIVLALAGAVLVGGGDFGGSSLRGDVLALAGGAAAAGYVMAGGRARQELGIFEYAVLTYAFAGVVLTIACVAGSVPLWGYPAQTWWAIAGIVAGPQLLGHTIINFTLKQLDPTTVSMTIMAEPVIATLLAFLLLSETPSWLVVPGGIAILAGIYLVTIIKRPVTLAQQ